MSDAEFWSKVRLTAAKAVWACIGTAIGNQPKVRVVHPAFEEKKLWIATGRNSAKARQIEKNPQVELFYQVSPPDLVHLTVTGKAGFIDDLAEKKRVWNGKIFDYDLSQFWPGGPESKDFGLLLVTPSRIELTSLAEMGQGKKPQVWRAS
ncbi:MAG TPA: pyridoxamine 5'-phosphate oxidase family protein [Candidatus Binataceae bacterium]